MYNHLGAPIRVKSGAFGSRTVWGSVGTRFPSPSSLPSYFFDDLSLLLFIFWIHFWFFLGSMEPPCFQFASSITFCVSVLLALAFALSLNFLISLKYLCLILLKKASTSFAGSRSRATRAARSRSAPTSPLLRPPPLTWTAMGPTKSSSLVPMLYF